MAKIRLSPIGSAIDKKIEQLQGTIKKGMSAAEKEKVRDTIGALKEIKKKVRAECSERTDPWAFPFPKSDK